MKKIIYFFVTLAVLGFSACSNDDDKISLPDISVNFDGSQSGIGIDSVSGKIIVNLSRQATIDLNVNINIAASDSIVYGTDYKTTPLATAKVLSLNIPAGSLSGSITIEKLNKKKLSVADSLVFTIASISSTNGIEIGSKNRSVFYFGEISSKGDLLTLNGRNGDNIYQNSVYVDFSSNSQAAVNRESWVLGFYSGNEYRVVLNSANQTTVISTGKTDITAVSLEDANSVINIGAASTALAIPSTSVDAYDGSLSGTAIAEISAIDTDNKVYLVTYDNHKSPRDLWYKVKINRSANGGYSVQYALVNDTNIKTTEISKNTAYNFSFLSLDNASTVNVEPEALKWDIMWSFYTINAGRPYFAQDIIVTNNIAGAQAAQVKTTSTLNYANFSKSDLSSITLSSNRLAIGSSWRAVVGPSLGVYTDRFYVVKDPNGSYYKLRFLKMGIGNDGGERGRPVIEYSLLK